MQCGKLFNSFNEFNVILKQYEKDNRQRFVIKGSRTVERAQTILERKLNKDLKYYEVQYICVHGGAVRSRGKGIRKTRTCKMNCPALIKLRATKTGDFLQIKQLVEKHENHDMSEEVYDYLPSNRKLSTNEQSIVKDLLDVRGNKKLIQQKILSSTGKLSTMKDISNIAYGMKSASNDLEQAVKELKDIHKCNVHILHDSVNQFRALYFSTDSMRRAIQSWPEFVSIDGTYKLLNLGFTVFIMLVEDSNGQTEIAAVALTAHEDKETFAWFMNMFKDENSICDNQIKCFMGDKDLLQRNVIKEIFPQAQVYICLFHTLKTMKREISKEKMNVTNEERIKALELLENLVYSRSEEEYDRIYQVLQETASQSVTTYYNKNWHVIKHEWTVYSMCHGNLLNRTNNRLEAINGKLKQVIEKNSSLAQFVKSFFIFLHSHEHERDSRTARLILTRPITLFSKDSCEFKYEEYLTPYASTYVQTQIEASKNVKVTLKDPILNMYEVESKGNKYIVSTNKCTCMNFTSMFLPCKHIFATRKVEKIKLFDKSLCSERWSKEFYIKHQRVTTRVTTTGENISVEPFSVTQVGSPTVQTVNQKRKKALFVTNSLANLASLSSGSSFNYKMKILEEMETHWREGHEVAIDVIRSTTDENTVQSSTNNFTETPNVEIEVIDLMEQQSNNQILSVNGHDQVSIPEDILDTNTTDDVIEIFVPNVGEFVFSTKSIETSDNEIIPENWQQSVSGREEITMPNEILDSHIIDADEIMLVPNGGSSLLAMESNGKYRNISDIVLPPKIKVKGRPKGADQTVIGLKRKRTKK